MGMNMGVITKIRRFIDSDRGSVSIVSVFALLLIIITAGGVLDMSILYKDKAYTRDMADNAVLAAAADFKRIRRGAAGRSTANELVNETSISPDGGKKYSATTRYKRLNSQQFEVTTTVSGTTEHFFLGIIGQPETKVSSASKSIVNLVEAEVILVLDVSHSMIKGTLLADMKSAAKSFVNELDPYEGDESYISFTILPYAETVNMGAKADIWLHPSDGLDYAPDFIGCFRHSDGRSVGALQGYPIGSTLHAGGTKYVPMCPPAESAALLNSTDKDEISSYIDGLDVGLGTGSDTGLIWAERMLTKSWRDRATFAAEPYKRLNAHTQKYIVFLTDGELTRADEDQNGIKGLQDSDDIPTYLTDVETSFISKCEDLKVDQTINVFTIGYSVNGEVVPNLKALLENCTSGSGRYFPAASSNVDEIFSSIRAEIQDVYLKN